MDGTTLIASAITAVITEVATGSSSGAAHAAYDALKKRLLERFGGKADVADALAKLEQRPDSAARQGMLQEELEVAAAGEDAELVAQAERLLRLLKKGPGGERAKAQVSGSGAVAQGENAVAAGAGGVAAQEIHGNVYVGVGTEDPAKALDIYCEVQAAVVRPLPLRGIDISASDPASGGKRLDLEQVYVALDTTIVVEPAVLDDARAGKLYAERVPASRPADSAGAERGATEGGGEKATGVPLRALAAVALHRRVVLKGEPGSGKSTFLNHLGMCLALHRVEPHAGWLARLPDWPATAAKLVPVFVILRDFAAYLGPTPGRAAAQQLWAFIEIRLNAQNLEFAAEPLAKALDQGGALLLLDGLDEIPNQQHREAVRDAIVAFMARYPKCRGLITCRTLAYEDPVLRFEGLPDYEVARFNEKQVDAFITAWYQQLDVPRLVKAGTADQMAARLKEAVRRPDLWRLARNPLLLTVMALVHAHEGGLLDARASLYEDTVDILLWRREQVKAEGEKAPSVLRQLLLQAQRSDVDLKRVLWRLAFEAQRSGKADDGESVADIQEWSLAAALAELHPKRSLDWASQVVAATKVRAGLLIERAPGVYTFPHRTFQEYLAGSHLAAQADFARQASGLMVEPSVWREAILLAVSRLVYVTGDVEKPLALVGELCPQKPKNEPAAWQRAWLAGQALEEIGLNRVQDSQLGKDLLERVQGRLVDLVAASAFTPRERASAGNTLARLGDPRFHADAWFLPNEPLLGFVEIPEGPFLMGTNQEDLPQPARELVDRGARLVPEWPMHEVRLPTFYIGRFPVTVAQFKSFLDDTRGMGHWLNNPFPRDSALGGPDNHQVFLVTWYDAMLYCQWLTHKLRSSPDTPEPLATLLHRGADGSGPWSVVLPTEAQWEKAARGTDGRLFPWGSEPDPARTKFGHQLVHRRQSGQEAYDAPVGCFSLGASPWGVEDMTGSWEWTRTVHSILIGQEASPFTYPYDPNDGREDLTALTGKFGRANVMLRGGTWSAPDEVTYFAGIRCSIRSPDRLGIRYADTGFRVSLASFDQGFGWMRGPTR